MAARSEIRRWLQHARRNWLTLAQGALWLSGILGGFLLPPPVGVLPNDEKIWLRLGQFIIAVVLGVVIFAGRRWRQPRHAARWCAVALLALALGVVAFLRYQQLTLAWTAVYDGGKVVTGSAYTPHGLAYRIAHPELSASDLIFDFAGQTEEIWTHASISRRRLILAGTFESCLPLFAVCLLGVVQAIHCSDRQARRQPRRQAAAGPG